MEYIETLGRGAHDCFLCHYWHSPADDPKNLVLWRTSTCMALFNRFPYTNGHMLIALGAHVSDLEQVPEEAMAEVMRISRDLIRVLRAEANAQGFNFGLNLGRCAGAGVPDHLHFHLVPRWAGDTNFMAVVDDVRVIPQSMQALYDGLKRRTATLNLPYARGTD